MTNNTRGTSDIVVSVMRITDKAVQVNDRGIEVWIPFSQIENVVGEFIIGKTVTLTLPTWLAEVKDLL